MPGQTYEDHTVGWLLEKWIGKLIEFKIPAAKESVERIVAHILREEKVDHVYNLATNIVSEDVEYQIEVLCNKRMQRMPMSYILQKHKFREFYLKMIPPVFIPWPETENLIDVALEVIDAKKPKVVLELCVGSGAISLAILKARPELQIIAVDKSEEACKLSRENAEALNLSDRITIINSRITLDGNIEGINQKFDVIISNPPYVPLTEIEGLGPEFTQYQDRAAVESGGDGMNLMKIVLSNASRLLNPDGRMVLEVHPSHPSLIEKLLKCSPKLGISFVRALKDTNNLYRYVEVVKTTNNL